jgi:hypothetical protein
MVAGECECEGLWSWLSPSFVWNELMMFRTPPVFQNGGIDKISALETFHDLNLEI